MTMLRALLPALLVLPACTSPGDDTASDATGASTSSATDMSESSGSSSAAPTTGDATASDATTNDDTNDDTTSDDTTGADPGPGIMLAAPCTIDVLDPTRLAVITNDLMDPASLHVVDLATGTLTPDLAPAPSDPALAWGDGKLIVLGRFGINTLDVYDGPTLTPLATHAVALPGLADANPQALAFGPDGRAYLSLFASATLPVYDLDLPPADAMVGSLDLAAFADKDGSPEPGVAFTCGDIMFVAIQRLEEFVPVDLSSLVAVDLTTGAVLDLDPTTDGPQALPLQGPWPKQVRLDPTDPTGHTVLVLTSGVERVDLSLGTSRWAVDPALLTAAGIDGYDPQAFTVAADGTSVHLLATDGDYPGAAVFHVGLDGLAPATPHVLVDGLTSREKTLERTGTTLWVGDAAPDKPRLRRFDLTDDSELTPVSTPGDPYLVLAIP